MTLKDKLILYMYHKLSRLENEKEELHQKMWTTSLDSLDHYEIMRAKVRISACEEILNDIYKIMFSTSQRKEQ